MKNKLKFIVLMLVITFCIQGCTDVDGATKTLERSGYKPIEVGGYAFFSGSKEDFYITKFKAVAPNGDTVTGCVTKGFWFKGNTIRLDD
jgi:hypothetical protein